VVEGTVDVLDEDEDDVVLLKSSALSQNLFSSYLLRVKMAKGG